MAVPSERLDAMFPRLTRAQIDRLRAVSRPRRFAGRRAALPRVFAVGDVRSGSMKRVASAVGEGSAAVQLVHKVLAE